MTVYDGFILSGGGEAPLPIGLPVLRSAFPDLPAFIPREWQKIGDQKLTKKLLDGAADFLLDATPGSGKTSFGVNVGRKLNGMEVANFTVVVAPTRSVKRQWVKSAARQGFRLSGRYDHDRLSYTVEEDLHGIVVTYAQACANPYDFSALCSRYEVYVILDEVHHVGENLKWGDAMKTAFSGAVFRLSLSGTPFRSDQARIPFVRYDQDGQCIPDHTYSYSQAIVDGVCRVVDFPVWRGSMTWMSGVDIVTAGFDDDLDEKGESQRLRTALDMSGDLLPGMIREAHQKLEEIRATGHDDAAGLICAIGIKEAKEIAQWMKLNLGVDPVVVHSEDKTSAKLLESFEKSRDKWLVSVDMVSEGVDIKRLRVGVFATNTITEMRFRQFVGRFVRWLDGIKGTQTAYVFIPGDSRIIALAGRIEQEVKNATMEKAKPEPGEEREPLPPSDFLPIGSAGYEDSHISREDVFSAQELESARRYQAEHPEYRGMSLASLARLLRGNPSIQSSMVDIPPLQTRIYDVIDPDAEHETLRHKTDKLNDDILAVLAPRELDRDDQDYGNINRHFNKIAGIPSVKVANTKQLSARIVAQQSVIVRLQDLSEIGNVRREILRRDCQTVVHPNCEWESLLD
jgi:superfamily II DNA or RNA helicase